MTWIQNNTTHSCPDDKRCGTGGFLPFGFSGVINGAAKCFFAFIGFDAIASTGEEVINPKKNIPLSILITLIVVGTIYGGLSVVITMMVPYYLINPDTPIAFAFEFTQLDWAKYIVTIGAVVSLSTW